jgi:hypothetical protein
MIDMSSNENCWSVEEMYALFKAFSAASSDKGVVDTVFLKMYSTRDASSAPSCH